MLYRQLLFIVIWIIPKSTQYLNQHRPYSTTSGLLRQDESGNFSITVLQTAIQRSHNLILKRYQTNNNASSNTDPSSSHGFVVNLHQHWFSLRPIYGAWWNLNSMLSQPTRVGDVYLSAYLGTLRMEGYTIFEVVGGCPPPAQSGGEYGLRMPSWGAETSWHSISDLVSNANGGGNGASAANPFPGVGNRLVSGGGGSGSGQDDDLARAIAASLAGNSNSNSGGDGMDAALAQALAMSRNDGKMGSMNENCDDMEDDDSALQRAIAMSMQGGSSGGGSSGSSSNSGNNNGNNDAEERRKKMLEAAEKRNKR